MTNMMIIVALYLSIGFALGLFIFWHNNKYPVVDGITWKSVVFMIFAWPLVFAIVIIILISIIYPPIGR